MCGIVGTIGSKDVRKYLIEGLHSLDYRGYDSAGITALDKSASYITYKVVGKVDELDAQVPEKLPANIGIGHTRWATHGQPSVENCHPHFSMDEEVALVHNGVIENYRQLKITLIRKGYKFYGETDSEVLANLLSARYKKTKNILTAIRETIGMVEGSFASAVIFKKDPNHIYFLKRSSPLLIGVAEDAYYIASDAVPMTKYTSKFIDILDEQYGSVGSDGVKIFQGFEEVDYKFTEKNPELLSRDLNGYPNYMLKEIEETPDTITRLIDNYFDGNSFLFDKTMIEELKKAEEVYFIACGTSYHASLQGVRYMRYLGKRSDAFIASEWAYFPIVPSSKSLFILISQSGETADLIRCQKTLNARGISNIAITNTKGSTIDRDATYSCLLYAGLEVAVASTKAYSAQVTLLALLVGAIEGRSNVIDHLHYVKEAMNEIILEKDKIEKIALEVKNFNMLFYVGRGNDYDAVRECALKMKEISYIHSEAFPGGELKHGPIAIVDTETAIIALISEVNTESAIRANVKEVEARGAKSFIISSRGLYCDGDAFKVPMVKAYLAILPMVFVGQYLAYYVAYHKGVNIDKPRNLAKSVTVE